MTLTVFSDGGARGNPGPAAIGIVIKNEAEVLYQKGQCIGETTNNVAEYTAIQTALEYLVNQVWPIETLICKLDSELVVKQLRGEYKLKQPHLKPFKEKIDSLIQTLISQGLRSITFMHIPRKENAQADKLVNYALDNQS